MKYTITDADSFHIKVQYEDGSWAQIATSENMLARDYAIAISQFQPKTGVSTDDLPVKVGDTGTVGDIPTDPYGGEATIDWSSARDDCYPKFQEQLEAAFKAREGDDTMQKGIDGNIKLVKAKFPKTDTLMTFEQFKIARGELSENDGWYNEAS